MPLNTERPARNTGYQMAHYIRADIVFGDSGVAKYVGTIPKDAVVIGAWACVRTAFNAGTGNVLDIGTAGDDDGFATDLALGTVGLIAADEFATSNDVYMTEDTKIYATPALSGTAATTGLATVIVQFVPKN